MDEKWKEDERRIFAFFKEHPIHAFKIEQIAKYLNLTEKEVKEGIYHLEILDIVELRYQFATSELAELVDEMTKVE